MEAAKVNLRLLTNKQSKAYIMRQYETFKRGCEYK